jgi:hypothetical protein
MRAVTIDSPLTSAFGIDAANEIEDEAVCCRAGASRIQFTN